MEIFPESLKALKTGNLLLNNIVAFDQDTNKFQSNMSLFSERAYLHLEM